MADRYGTCIHCERDGRVVGRRLCRRCHYRPEIRNQYPLEYKRVNAITGRIEDTLELTRMGESTEAIAKRLCVSDRTITRYRARLKKEGLI